MNAPTAAQVVALRKYKATHGRTWKSKLRQQWESGTNTSPELQQVRNNLGPAWLTKNRSV